MLIKFMCPNGHPLAAPQQRIGKQGTCPKCKTAFIIPSPDETEDETPDESPDEGEDEGQQVAEDRAARSHEDLFVFLCPNGHKLNGPNSLKGHPGQCPHCGARFRIPSDDDEDEEEFASPDMPTGTFVDQEEVGSEELENVEQFSEEVELIAEEWDEEGTLVRPLEPSRLASLRQGPHPLATLVGQLWAGKEDQNVLELHLRDGQVVTAHLFSPSLSQQGYGVFATRNADGSYTLSTIAWDAMSRVGMGNVRQLPRGLFS